MGKFLGIDYGSKRIGLAITDDAKIISSPLDTILNVEIFKLNLMAKDESFIIKHNNYIIILL